MTDLSEPTVPVEEDEEDGPQNIFEIMVTQEEDDFAGEAPWNDLPAHAQETLNEVGRMAAMFTAARVARFKDTGIPEKIRVRVQVEVLGTRTKTSSGLYVPPTGLQV